jgi:nucleoside-diphosphate-sugar epimerase
VPTALVTGATGLVGTHTTQRLRRDGWAVRALVRDAARARALSDDGVTLATGDTLDAASVAAAARGCDVVFHTAAAVTPSGGWEAFSRPNIEGTRNVIAAAAAAHARLVHVSSVAVYGSSGRYAKAGRKTDEDMPLAPLPEQAFYARSKRESEALVLEAHAAGRLWATAVRPDVIYGTHDRQFVPRLARMLRRLRFAPIIGGGRNTLAIVHAANVADGMVRAATIDAAGGRAYNLANDFDVTTRDFFRLAGEGLGISLHMANIPFVVVRAALGVASMVAGSRWRVAMDASLGFLTRDNPFTSERARRELGWNPVVRPEVGVPEAFQWTSRAREP